MDYKDYLQSEEWQVTKERKLKAAGYKCELTSQTKNLNVHHKTYDRLGCELDSDLIVLSTDVHNVFHRHFKNIKSDLWGLKG